MLNNILFTTSRLVLHTCRRTGGHKGRSRCNKGEEGKNSVHHGECRFVLFYLARKCLFEPREVDTQGILRSMPYKSYVVTSMIAIQSLKFLKIAVTYGRKTVSQRCFCHDSGFSIPSTVPVQHSGYLFILLLEGNPPHEEKLRVLRSTALLLGLSCTPYNDTRLRCTARDQDETAVTVSPDLSPWRRSAYWSTLSV